MASGSYYVLGDYVPVEANAVTTMSANNSGGETIIPGYYINWTETGVTGKNWDGLIGHSLFAYTDQGDLMTTDYILAEIEKNGNLNNLFSRLSTLNYSGRKEFESYIVGIYGATPGGCIGDPL